MNKLLFENNKLNYRYKKWATVLVTAQAVEKMVKDLIITKSETHIKIEIMLQEMDLEEKGIVMTMNIMDK